MPTSLLAKDLVAHRFSVLRNVLRPLGLLDLAIVRRPHVKTREASIAAESIAGEDVGEDRGTIDAARAVSANVTDSTHDASATKFA